MVQADHSPRRDHIATASSIAIHLCALVALALVPEHALPQDDPDERALLASVIRIEHRPPPRVTRPRQAVTAAVALRPALVPVIHAAVAVEHAKRKLVVATEHRAAVIAPVRPHAPPRLAKVVATPPQLALAATKPADGSLAPPTPTPQPTASPAPSPVVAARDDGIGNFGETYPASIEPALRGGLIAGVGAFDVRITVDESGHAVAVDFIRAPADPALRDELRTRILAAHFIPAACNGLRCAGIVELKAAN